MVQVNIVSVDANSVYVVVSIRAKAREKTQWLFRHLLKGVEADFDIVLIDTKPQVNILLQAALAASNWYLIPSFPETDSYDGFVDLVAECEEIWEEERLLQLVKDSHTLSADDLAAKIRDTAMDFTGEAPQFDDFTLMVIKMQ